MNQDTPITFEALSYALFDVEQNAVLTTAHGSLAIFSTKGMAEAWVRSSRRNIRVVPVQIQPVAPS
ncbi:MAG: hypothetical protein RLZZ200_497 [Pseudomonadota bacterium]